MDSQHPMTPATQVEAWNREHPIGTRVKWANMEMTTVGEAFVDADGKAMIFVNYWKSPVLLKDVKPVG